MGLGSATAYMAINDLKIRKHLCVFLVWHGVSKSPTLVGPKVDVTLAKIEEIDNHFIAWSSSVLASRWKLSDLCCSKRVKMISCRVTSSSTEMFRVFALKSPPVHRAKRR